MSMLTLLEKRHKSRGNCIEATMNGEVNRASVETLPPRNSKRKKSSGNQGGRCRKSRKATGLPRRPLSAYNAFFREERLVWLESQKKNGNNAHTTASASDKFNEVGRVIGARWKALSADKKHKYIDIAEKDTLRYQREMKMYNDKFVDTDDLQRIARESKPVAVSADETIAVAPSQESQQTELVPLEPRGEDTTLPLYPTMPVDLLPPSLSQTHTSAIERVVPQERLHLASDHGITIEHEQLLMQQPPSAISGFPVSATPSTPNAAGADSYSSVMLYSLLLRHQIQYMQQLSNFIHPRIIPSSMSSQQDVLHVLADLQQQQQTSLADSLLSRSLRGGEAKQQDIPESIGSPRLDLTASLPETLHHAILQQATQPIRPYDSRTQPFISSIVSRQPSTAVGGPIRTRYIRTVNPGSSSTYVNWNIDYWGTICRNEAAPWYRAHH